MDDWSPNPWLRHQVALAAAIGRLSDAAASTLMDRRAATDLGMLLDEYHRLTASQLAPAREAPTDAAALVEDEAALRPRPCPHHRRHRLRGRHEHRARAV